MGLHLIQGSSLRCPTLGLGSSTHPTLTSTFRRAHLSCVPWTPALATPGAADQEGLGAQEAQEEVGEVSRSEPLGAQTGHRMAPSPGRCLRAWAPPKKEQDGWARKAGLAGRGTAERKSGGERGLARPSAVSIW